METNLIVRWTAFMNIKTAAIATTIGLIGASVLAGTHLSIGKDDAHKPSNVWKERSQWLGVMSASTVVTGMIIAISAKKPTIVSGGFGLYFGGGMAGAVAMAALGVVALTD